ncbi:hypothetical protein EBT31_12880, partial [bacterium]|nr:hypothetical protein [bacterium]
KMFSPRTRKSTEMALVIKRINDRWWMLTSDDGVVRLTWFGYSRAEVLGRFNSYIRSVDLQKIRFVKKEIAR